MNTESYAVTRTGSNAGHYCAGWEERVDRNLPGAKSEGGQPAEGVCPKGNAGLLDGRRLHCFSWKEKSVASTQRETEIPGRVESA